MKKKDSLYFTKLSGAGNDFLIIDLRSKKKAFSFSFKKKIVQKACDRHFGVGADGLIFLEKAKNRNNDFRWDFYNKDGSKAEMCLNASRCVIRYELENNKTAKKIRFESAIGEVTGKKLNSGIEVEIPISKKEVTYKTLNTKSGHQTNGYYVNSGVPHFVVQKKLSNIKSLKEVSSEFRFHKEFKKPGSNVTYWEKKKSKIDAITFERGVEDFTLACGTGAVAVGLVFDYIYKKNPIRVQMPGGQIKVSVKKESALIQGPAEIICKGVLCLKV